VSVDERKPPAAPCSRTEKGAARDQFGFPAVDALRDVAFQCDAIEDPIVAQVPGIGDGQVCGCAVVPEGDAAGLPLKSDRVLGLGGLGPQQLQQPLALVRAEPPDLLRAPGETRRDEQRAFAGERMDSDGGMVRDEIGLFDLAVPLTALGRTGLELMPDVQCVDEIA
jgi:hypothetical protein